jgi:hypothetical protein
MLLAGSVAGVGGAGGAIDLDQLPDAIATLLCPTLVACDVYPDLARCSAAQTWISPTFAAAISRGTIVYDAVAAAECVHDRAMNGCRGGQNYPEACNRMLEGRVATGGACIDNEECFGEGSCAFNVSDCRADYSCCIGACEGGITAGIVPAGGDCSVVWRCERGTFCSNAFRCVPLLSPGSSCTYTGQCAPPAVCVGANGPNQPGKCVLLRAEGEGCDPATAPCADRSSYCDPVSLRCVRSKKPGESCDNAPCVEYASCEPVGGATGGVSVGGSVGTAGASGGLGGATGSRTTGVPGAGSVCRIRDEAPVSCQNDSDCRGGLVCAWGTCTFPPCVPDGFPPRTISADNCGLTPSARDLPRAANWDALCAGRPDCSVTSGKPDHEYCPNTCSCACYDGVCYQNTCTTMDCVGPEDFR